MLVLFSTFSFKGERFDLLLAVSGGWLHFLPTRAKCGRTINNLVYYCNAFAFVVKVHS